MVIQPIIPELIIMLILKSGNLNVECRGFAQPVPLISREKVRRPVKDVLLNVKNSTVLTLLE